MEKQKKIIKRTFLALMTASVCMFMISCAKGKNQSEDNGPILNLLTFPNQLPMEEFPISYTNSVKGHDEKKTIYGSFLEGSIDTLYIEKTNKENVFQVVSSNPKIPTLTLEYTVSPALVNEGDLDGNGTTEVGILDTWHTSSCRLYKIYTLRNKKWYYIIPPLETSESVRASGVELAEPTGIKNKVRIRYADFTVPLSSCANSPMKDTIVTASFVPIKNK